MTKTISVRFVVASVVALATLLAFSTTTFAANVFNINYSESNSNSLDSVITISSSANTGGNTANGGDADEADAGNGGDAAAEGEGDNTAAGGNGGDAAVLGGFGGYVQTGEAVAATGVNVTANSIHSLVNIDTPECPDQYDITQSDNWTAFYSSHHFLNNHTEDWWSAHSHALFAEAWEAWEANEQTFGYYWYDSYGNEYYEEYSVTEVLDLYEEMYGLTDYTETGASSYTEASNHFYSQEAVPCEINIDIDVEDENEADIVIDADSDANTGDNEVDGGDADDAEAGNGGDAWAAGDDSYYPYWYSPYYGGYGYGYGWNYYGDEGVNNAFGGNGGNAIVDGGAAGTVHTAPASSVSTVETTIGSIVRNFFLN